MAAKTSVKASLQSLHDKPYPSLGLCDPQAVLEETPVLHIHDCSNQCHVLLQCYACKRVRLECEASGLHNLWSILRKCIKSNPRRPEIQNVPVVVAMLCTHLCAPCIAGIPLRFSAYALALNTQTVPPLQIS